MTTNMAPAFVVSCVALCWALQLALGASPVLFHKHQSTAVYTSASASSHADLDTWPTAAFGTWLNAPISVEAVSSGPGKTEVEWVHRVKNTQGAYSVVMATHLNAASVGPVDTILAESSSFAASETASCTLSGFDSTVRGEGVAIWTVHMAACYFDAVASPGGPLAVSDDGSTVAFQMFSYVGNKTFVPRFLALEGQTGHVIFSQQPVPANAQPYGGTVSVSANGTVLSFVNGEYVYVYTNTGLLRTKPIVRPYGGFAQLCPMGEFLVWGVLDGYISRWDPVHYVYAPVFTIPGNGSYEVEYAEISLNGGLDAPNGCLVAFSWANIDDEARQDVVTVNSMLTGDQVLVWTSATNSVDQTLADLSFFGPYLAIADWGDGTNATVPTVILLNVDQGATPIFTFHTPGSMFGVQLIAWTSRTGEHVIIATAGKHVAASALGNGGDAYIVEVPPSCLRV